MTGLVIGAVSGYGAARLMGDEECEFVCGAAQAGSAVLGGALGLLLGGIGGASTPHGPERWQPVPVDARP